MPIAHMNVPWNSVELGTAEQAGPMLTLPAVLAFFLCKPKHVFTLQEMPWIDVSLCRKEGLCMAFSITLYSCFNWEKVAYMGGPTNIQSAQATKGTKAKTQKLFTKAYTYWISNVTMGIFSKA